MPVAASAVDVAVVCSGFAPRRFAHSGRYVPGTVAVALFPDTEMLSVKSVLPALIYFG